MDLRKLTEMAEPTTTATAATGGALLLNKLIAILLPVGASLLAFWLGLRFVPIRKGHEREDMVNRVMGCLFSSFILGITVLVLLYHHWPGIFISSGKLAQAAGLPYTMGFFTWTASVLIVCAIPGPWIVAGIFLWLEKRKGKDIGEMLKDFRNDIKNDIRSDRPDRYERPWQHERPFPYEAQDDVNYDSEDSDKPRETQN